MNRTLWIARAAAVLILLAFLILMVRLHGQLTAMNARQPVAAEESDAR